MKDSSVGPAGLLNPNRQRRLLESLAIRCQTCVSEQEKLLQEHQFQQQIEESSLADAKAATTDVCRKRRREMLDLWDNAEENLTSEYEATALKIRGQLNQVDMVFKKKHAEGVANIERKVEARKQAVQHQYDQRKDQPGEQRDKEIAEINNSLKPIYEDLEWGRALTIRRLDRLPEVPPASSPEENMREKEPTSIRETTDTIHKLSKKCKGTVAEMQTGFASKVVDSFYLPAAAGVIVVFWAIGALVFGPEEPWLWMAAGVPIAGVVCFSIYAILLWPLKRMTRRLHPKAERIGQAAEECAASGRKIATDIAAETSRELLDRRDTHYENAKKWRVEQLAELKQELEKQKQDSVQKLVEASSTASEQYSTKFAATRKQMHEKAEMLAQQITSAISEADQDVNQKRQSSAEQRKQQLVHLARRLKQGISKGVERIASTETDVQTRYPDWSEVDSDSFQTSDRIDFLPIGSLQIKDRLRESLSVQAGTNGSATQLPAVLSETEIPESLPIAIHRRLYSGLVIKAHQSQMESAIAAAHHVLWRLLTSVSPSRAKLTLIDPQGRGQHFTSFMALADHDPALVNHRVWTTENKIDERLGELAHHVEDVLQSSLRDRFERIEDYNEVAGAMAEPYRAVAAIGFPESLTRSGYKHLNALIESGLRCGIFTVLVVDRDRPWSGDMPLPKSDKLLNLNVEADGTWSVEAEGIEHLPFVPGPVPSSAVCNSIVQRVGEGAIAASKVEIPLSSILPPESQASGCTDDGIQITVGSQGANRTLALELGEGVRQHVLIAGKTGSGKSTLLHSIITSGAYRYQPDQLEFYLLDFKKGVEFKPYADHDIPHARVIGIESEREFGRSVLQRLDAELQSRGERFRAAGVQDVGAFRQATGETMPRIMLVVDEFQELFVRDDRLANDCSMLLDRLVRQGRSFGIHVILSSQSLAGAYSLPRATLGQMAVRVAMHCSESDAALILSDDNTAARLLSRPGEAIYNDAGGLVEGNQPFQVAWLASSDHLEMLQQISQRDQSFTESLDPPVVFEGNRPCRWTPALADASIRGDESTKAGLRGLLGESVEIGPPLALDLTRNAGRNVLLITPSETRAGIITTLVATIKKQHIDLQVVYLDGSRVDDCPSMSPWFEEAGIEVEAVKPRDSEKKIVELSELVKERGEDSTDGPILIVIDPLERFRDLRQGDTFNFSLENPTGGVGASQALRDIMSDGPNANVFVLLSCAGAETLGRWLPRSSHHDLELRILGRMNASDSSTLIDSPVAAELTTATMLLYDDSDGRVTKFRQCDQADPAEVKTWLQSK